jgi:hypothetical protein
LKGLCFFQDVEILPFEVFLDGSFADFLIVELQNTAGNAEQSGSAGSQPAAFAGDELKAIVVGANEQRLQDAVLPNAFGQFFEGQFFEGFSRLKGIAVDAIDVDVVVAVAAVGRRGFDGQWFIVCAAEQRVQPASQSTDPRLCDLSGSGVV